MIGKKKTGEIAAPVKVTRTKKVASAFTDAPVEKKTKKVKVVDAIDGVQFAEKMTKKSLEEAMQDQDIESIALIVEAYYRAQEDRIRDSHRKSSLDKSNKNSMLFQYLAEQSTASEATIKRAMEIWVQQNPIGAWCYQIDGIGPILAAGLAATFSVMKKIYDEEDNLIEEKPIHTAGGWWKYAGIEVGGKKRAKGEKITWNPFARRLTFILGECFVKVSGKETAFYAQIYREKKEFYTKKNEAGGFRENAEREIKRYGTATESYKHLKDGKLPPAHIHAMARRYAVKIFLSHLHAECYRYVFKKEPPVPFAIGILNHAHPIDHPYGRITDL